MRAAVNTAGSQACSSASPQPRDCLEREEPQSQYPFTVHVSGAGHLLLLPYNCHSQGLTPAPP